MAPEALLHRVFAHVVGVFDGEENSGHLRAPLHAERGREPLRLRLGLELFSTHIHIHAPAYRERFIY